MDLGAMVTKWYSTFPQTQALLEFLRQIFSVIGGVLPPGRDEVGVVYSSRLYKGCLKSHMMMLWTYLMALWS